MPKERVKVGLPTRLIILDALIAVVRMPQEVPVGYIGVPDEGLASLREAEALLEGLSDEGDRREFAAQVAEERALIHEYLRKQ